MLTRILAIEETFTETGKINRGKSYLEKTYPELNLPANAIALRGDAAFSVELNGNPHQHLEAYATPFRIPKIDAKVSGYKLEGTDTKVVNIIIWYKARRVQREVK